MRIHFTGLDTGLDEQEMEISLIVVVLKIIGYNSHSSK